MMPWLFIITRKASSLPDIKSTDRMVAVQAGLCSGTRSWFNYELETTSSSQVPTQDGAANLS